jgi:cytochrome b6-f complex iron-sulfur subunit
MENVSERIVPANEEDRGTRRAFMGAAALAGAAYAGAIGYPVYRYLASPIAEASAAAAVTEVSLKDAQKLTPGSVLMFKFGSQPAMLIHHKDGEWVALGAVCTHLGCTVQYFPATNKIQCACHGGQYDPQTGQNIGGPPPKPLRKFKVKVADDAVVVARA